MGCSNVKEKDVIAVSATPHTLSVHKAKQMNDSEEELPPIQQSPQPADQQPKDSP